MTTPTPDLTSFIVDAVKRHTDADAIRERVDTQVGIIIDDAIKQSFRSYGDIAKKLEAAVAVSLNVGDRIELPEYGNMVLALLRAKMDAVTADLVQKRIDAEMTEILGLAPKELKLSAVVETMVKSVEEWEMQDRHGTYATCHVEPSDVSVGYFRIALDREADKGRFDCELQFQVGKDGSIFGLSVEKQDAKSRVRAGFMEPFMKMVFTAYCCGSTFIIDNQDPPTNIGDF